LNLAQLLSCRTLPLPGRPLIEPAGEGVWTYPEGLQGTRTDLSVAIGFEDGELIAAAQWTHPEHAHVQRFFAGKGRGAARVMTFARAAVARGAA